jgi:D-alanyl-D-alanine carboxypeptidase
MASVTYQRARAAPRRIRIRRLRVAVLVVVLVAIAAALGHRSPASSPRVAAPPTEVHHARRSGQHGALGIAGGAVPAGTTVFDDEVPGVAKLDPGLLGALRRAATDAGIQFHVDSGWRSPAYQEQLLHDAISKYGSEAAASRWVATPGTSEHVKGHAVDVGPSGAAAWLAAHGAAYGLCQIYGNEPWHYELRPDAAEHGCPPMYADPTHDPRMRHE